LRRLWRQLRGGLISRRRAAASVAVGLFVGALPVYGLHLPLVLLICVPARLDVVTAYLAANVSNPLFAPFLVFAEVQVGALALSGKWAGFDLERARNLDLADVGGFLALGSVLVGAALAALGAAITHRLMPKSSGAAEQLESAIARAAARYASAPRRDRVYARLKLNSDPATSVLAGLGAVGTVLDAGCSRGQFGILLAELGAADRVIGRDWDERRLAAATQASSPQDDFALTNLLDAEWPPADTILLLDVLHYLPVAEQDAVLVRAAATLRPGGRLLVRQLETRRSLAKLWERLAVGLGVYRASSLRPRKLEQAAEVLREQDLVVQLLESPALWGNRFLLASASQTRTAPSPSSGNSSVSRAPAASESGPASASSASAR
jgi:uncharacterized protein (DUF2062 family)